MHMLRVCVCAPLCITVAVSSTHRNHSLSTWVLLSSISPLLPVLPHSLLLLPPCHSPYTYILTPPSIPPLPSPPSLPWMQHYKISEPEMKTSSLVHCIATRISTKDLLWLNLHVGHVLMKVNIIGVWISRCEYVYTNWLIDWLIYCSVQVSVVCTEVVEELLYVYTHTYSPTYIHASVCID